MADEGQSAARAAFVDAVRRVQALDPTSTEAPVRQFLTEILEAEAALRAIDLEGNPLPVSFSPAWADGSKR